MGVRENGRARVRHARDVSPRVSPSRAPVFSCAHCFQATATRANCNYISLSDKQIKDLRLLLFYVKQYLYTCKRMQKKATTSEFISKLIIQLKIDSQLDVTAFPSSKIKMLVRLVLYLCLCAQYVNVFFSFLFLGDLFLLLCVLL